MHWKEPFYGSDTALLSSKVILARELELKDVCSEQATFYRSIFIKPLLLLLRA